MPQVATYRGRYFVELHHHGRWDLGLTTIFEFGEVTDLHPLKRAYSTSICAFTAAFLLLGERVSTLL